MFSGQDAAQCNHLCAARRSELPPCDSADCFDDPELLALGHAILDKQCELGFGYAVATSEVSEQAVITGHNRAESLEMAILLLGRGPPIPEFARAVSKRRLKDPPARHGQTTTQSNGDLSTNRLQFYPVASGEIRRANYRLVLIPPQRRLCKLNRGSDWIPRVFEPGELIFNEGSVCSVSGATDPFPPPPGRGRGRMERV